MNQASSEWGFDVEGSASDLKLLDQVAKAIGGEIRGVGERKYLVLECVKSELPHQAADDKIRRFIDRFNTCAQISDSLVLITTVNGTCELRSDGSVGVFMSAHMRARSHASVGPHHPLAKDTIHLLRSVYDSGDMGDCIDLLQGAPNWFEMYKVVEIMKHAKVDHLSKRNSKRISATASDDRLAGPLARHARSAGDSFGNPVSISEARGLLREAVLAWAQGAPSLE